LLVLFLENSAENVFSYFIIKNLKIKINKPKRLLKTCIWVMLGLNLGQDTGYPETFTVDFLSLSRQIPR
jgi:hypothetical protein